MERDCLMATGNASLLKERFMESADKFGVFVGKESETMVVGNPDKNFYYYDGKTLNPEEVSEIHIPYAMKLLIHELTAMGIDFRVKTGDEED